VTVNFGDPNNARNKKDSKNDVDEEEDLERAERKKREDDMFEKIMKQQRAKLSKIDFI
jgi:hypothetical protein